jgi:hypothetical protein
VLRPCAGGDAPEFFAIEEWRGSAMVKKFSQTNEKIGEIYE